MCRSYFRLQTGLFRSCDFRSLLVTSYPVAHAHAIIAGIITSQHDLKYDLVRTHILLRSFPHSWFITVWRICLRPVFLFVCVELAFVMLSNYIMFVVSCFNIRYDFRVKTMFDLPWISFVLHRVPVLFMLFVFIYVYWCPNLFPYQMMFVLFNKQRRFSHMEQELPTLPEHLSAPWGLVRFVWLDI